MGNKLDFYTGDEEKIVKSPANGAGVSSGRVYFTVDENLQLGKIFYDYNNKQRVNIVPDIVYCGDWNYIGTLSNTFLEVPANAVLYINTKLDYKPVTELQAGDDILISSTVANQAITAITTISEDKRMITTSLGSITVPKNAALMIDNMQNYRTVDILKVGDKIMISNVYALKKIGAIEYLGNSLYRLTIMP